MIEFRTEHLVRVSVNGVDAGRVNLHGRVQCGRVTLEIRSRFRLME